MAGWAHNDFLDSGLQWIIDNCDEMIICSTQPTTYTEATSTYALADVAITSGDFTGPTDDTSGRKIIVAEKSGITIDASGTGNHVCLVGTIATVDKLMYVAPCQSIILAAGGTTLFPSWEINNEDPS